jgi:hypothetical protein
MASTRINSDLCRQAKQNEQQTALGRYMLNAPGNGESPYYIADPQVILQGWGANLRTNTINLESELMGVNRPLGRDCLGKDEYQHYDFKSSPIQYPTYDKQFTEQSRTVMPAWTARDLEQTNWYILPLNPQENTCMPFQNNISTRILEKDYYVAKIPCNLSNDRNYSLPTAPVKGGYVGGPNTCTTDNSCKKYGNL